MHSGVAGVALVPAPVRGPLVLVWLPWELALVDESFFVLLRGVSRSADWFVVDVMLWVFENLLQPGCCLLVDAHVVLVEGFLPVLSLFVVECACSFVGCKGSISLSPSEMGFIAGCFRCSCVLVDVQWCDLLEHVVLNAFGETFKPMPLSWVCPCLPNGPQLNHHIHRREDVLG